MSSTRQGLGDVSPGPRPALVSVEELQARIQEVDPLVRAVCTPNPAAASDAARLDTERADGRVRGPLHGVPVLVKDNIDTADLPTTAGSLALADQPPPPDDAPLVRRLRAAGCVILGKTNLSEWANFRGYTSTSGWSAYGGLTRNPYALNRSAGGSSSGSGAAVAAGLADFAIGTETNGSIVCPAALNGVVGLKPTVGLVPQQGIIPISHSQDTAGPMTRTVAQSAALLTVLTGGGTDYLEHCRGEDLSDVRIGVPRGSLWGYSTGLDQATERALELLSRCGATLVDHLSLPTPADDDQLQVPLHELKVGLAAYLATRKEGAPRTLEDLIAFNREHADEELTWFGQELFERAEATEGLDSPVYVAARLSALRSGRDGIDDLLRDNQLDALVAPAYSPAWTIDLVNGDHVLGSSSSHAALAGYPLISVPSGMVAGLPVGVVFSGTGGSDATLIRLAHALETARIAADGPFPTPEFRQWV
ncbi:Amidase [Kribbella flavida DSM 17836]|uniref:Amidase n=1 Tax=Kribbella flavida (strain DSM 17836 / JCM 10339 / NBRC 14399) TaxID=479435 RepID=D2Q406_KRIFD|nr:amidase [Kribbella flavida]ADB30320.1 Amidase [Kribbella flavida DSM 17836]